MNRVLGLVINGIITFALIGSVGLLVRALPSHKESPLELLRSGGLYAELYDLQFSTDNDTGSELKLR